MITRRPSVSGQRAVRDEAVVVGLPIPAEAFVPSSVSRREGRHPSCQADTRTVSVVQDRRLKSLPLHNLRHQIQASVDFLCSTDHRLPRAPLSGTRNSCGPNVDQRRIDQAVGSRASPARIPAIQSSSPAGAPHRTEPKRPLEPKTETTHDACGGNIADRGMPLDVYRSQSLRRAGEPKL